MIIKKRHKTPTAPYRTQTKSHRSTLNHRHQHRNRNSAHHLSPRAHDLCSWRRGIGPFLHFWCRCPILMGLYLHCLLCTLEMEIFRKVEVSYVAVVEGIISINRFDISLTADAGGIGDWWVRTVALGHPAQPMNLESFRHFQPLCKQPPLQAELW